MARRFREFEKKGISGTPTNPFEFNSRGDLLNMAGSSGSKATNPWNEEKSELGFRTLSDSSSSEDKPLLKTVALKRRSQALGPTNTHKPTKPLAQDQPAGGSRPMQIQPIRLCETCGLEGGAAKITVPCHLCKVVWHVACIRRHLPPDFNLHLAEEFQLCCPQCVYPVGGRWDQLM